MYLYKRIFDFTLWFLPFTPKQKPIGIFPEHEKHLDTALEQSCINGPHNRGCWIDGFNIDTDYEKATPPGKLIEYDFTLTNTIAYPDGYIAPAMLVNGIYPGPTIEADWGDTIRVTVHNNLTNHNGTAIHWHGIRQHMTNIQDGVAGVTQCPITPNMTRVYEFKAEQYGTSWYHSHFSLQYSDGILGAIHIKGPTSMAYGHAMEPLLLTDWYHEDAFSLFQGELEKRPPVPASNLLNGKGVFPCDPVNDVRCTGLHFRHEIQFVKDQTYKLSFINTGVTTQFKLWIDGHNFTVVQTDFVPIEPYVGSVLNIGIGQRYDLIVTANASFAQGTNFWIHARDCGNKNQESTLGIIRYDLSNHDDPFTPPVNADQGSRDCSDEDASKLHPIVPRTVGEKVNSIGPSDRFEAGVQGYPDINIPANNSTLNKWILANSSLYIDWREPSLKLLNEDKTFPNETAPVFLDYETDSWVYFLILNNFTSTTSNTPRQPIPPVTHPIHLHGHDFVILAQSNTTFNASNPLPPIPFKPARRDVAMLPANGYLLIAFQIDNPGAWLMHCHIAWHASAGLALQFIEQPGKIKGLFGEDPGLREECAVWRDYYERVNVPANATQDDSGI